jgi:hypothetical protein
LGKSHACEGVLLRITGHAEGLLWLTPFQQRQGELIPKRVFSVNAAVVHCNKKPEPGRSLGRASLSGEADAGGWQVIQPAPIPPAIDRVFLATPKV